MKDKITTRQIYQISQAPLVGEVIQVGVAISRIFSIKNDYLQEPFLYCMIKRSSKNHLRKRRNRIYLQLV